MSKRVCLDCPAFTNKTRCPACERKRDQARGSSTARGYGHDHQRLRAHYQRRMDQGEPFHCWRCGDPIDPTFWDLGHVDSDRTKYRGPECITCNRGTATRR